MSSPALHAGNLPNLRLSDQMIDTLWKSRTPGFPAVVFDGPKGGKVIDHKDFMHGAALVAIVDSGMFTALNRASVKYGHYVVNHDRHLFIKYNDGKGPGDYFFTFSGEDKKRITSEAASLVFAVLVCGNEVVTGIAREELSQLITLTASAASTVKVSVQQGRQIRISGPNGKLPLISRRSFPTRILE
ncbi:hypothetical protein ACIG0D_13300 [Streptomyces sp. NPDC052773]|uniref:hypothetical protein n=1 Tax=Streptomyces sp. NPDC052773 TaxID=3365693 RepID=UPI0037D03A0A